MEKLIEEFRLKNPQWDFDNDILGPYTKWLEQKLIEVWEEAAELKADVEFKKWKDLFENDRGYKTQLSDSSRKISCLLEENAELKKQLEEVKEKANHLLHLHACEQEGLSSGQPSFMDWMKATSELSEVLTKTENDE